MYEEAAFRENQAATAKCRTGSSHNGNFSEGPREPSYTLYSFCLSNVVKESRRGSVEKKQKKHPSSCGFLMDQLALVQDGTLLTKKLKATGLNRHLLSLVLFLKHEMGDVLVHFNWRCSESGSLRASSTSDLKSRVSLASCCLDDLLQINLHISPGLFSGCKDTKRYCPCWQAMFWRLFWLFGSHHLPRLFGSVAFSLKTSRCKVLFFMHFQSNQMWNHPKLRWANFLGVFLFNLPATDDLSASGSTCTRQKPPLAQYLGSHQKKAFAKFSSILLYFVSVFH